MSDKYFSVDQIIRCIKKLKMPYPTELLGKFISGYVGSFTRHTSPEHIYFNGKDVKIEKDPTMLMSNEDMEDMLMSLLQYHRKTSDIYKRYQRAIIELPKRKTSPIDKSAVSKTARKAYLKQYSLLSPKNKKEIIEEIDFINDMIIELGDISTEGYKPLNLDALLDILFSAETPVDRLTIDPETKYFVMDLWTSYNGGKIPSDKQWIKSFSKSTFDRILASLGENKKKSPPKKSFYNEDVFMRLEIRKPKLDPTKRWEIGISSALNVGEKLSDIRNYVMSLKAKYPEIYLLKFIKPEVAKDPKRISCSRAEIYLETDEPNIQRYLDEFHDLLPKKLVDGPNSILPNTCYDKPKFMSSIPLVQSQHTQPGEYPKHKCIFTFSQGGEDIYEGKEGLSQKHREMLFDGESYYKFFGTRDLAIDNQIYDAAYKLIEESGDYLLDVMKSQKYDNIEDARDILRGQFTDLLFSLSMSIEDLEPYFKGQLKNKDIGYQHTHGITSEGEIVIVTKPIFLGKGPVLYSNFIKSTGEKLNLELSAKLLNKESEAFTYFFPYQPEANPCDKDQPWCNITASLPYVKEIDVLDVILVPDQRVNEVKEILSKFDIPSNRIISYGESMMVYGEEAYRMGMLPFNKNYNMSLHPFTFVNVQKEYMKRLLYYGLFKDSMHKYK